MNNFTIPQELRCTASIPELTEIMKKLHRLEEQNEKILKKLDESESETSSDTSSESTVFCCNRCDKDIPNESYRALTFCNEDCFKKFNEMCRECEIKPVYVDNEGKKMIVCYDCLLDNYCDSEGNFARANTPEP